MLVDVLGVEPSTASFYLEASQWNPHAAVQFHMQTAGGGLQAAKRPKPKPPRFESTPVEVVGLPHGWAARVSATGTIVFQHADSGHEQSEVPPGFGRRAVASESASSMSSDAQMRDAAAAEAGAPAEAPGPAAQEPPGPAAWYGRVVCDGCQARVSGTRYQCLTRTNFDLCDACMWSDGSTLRGGHRWLKMSHINLEEADESGGL
eukprot:5015578-Prymnesium_polylepis.1